MSEGKLFRTGCSRVIAVLAAFSLSSCGGLFSSGVHSGFEQPSYRTIKLANSKKYIGRLDFPIKNGRYNSGFGPRWSNFHEGIDITAPEGTPVYAAHDGRVVFSGVKFRGYGKMVVVKADTLLTVYAHNSRILVDKGDYVRRGQQIAAVGSTGNASGAHLHYEIRILDKRGKWVAVDPLAFYP